VPIPVRDTVLSRTSVIESIVGTRTGLIEVSAQAAGEFRVNGCRIPGVLR
jgi:hypothetical protein